MTKAKVTIKIEKDIVLDGGTLEDFIKEVEDDYYGFLTTGDPELEVVGKVLD